MQYSTLLALLAVTVATSTVTADCARASIQQTCVTSQNANVLACKGNSACLCTRLKLRAACYDNCPTDATSTAAAAKDTADATTACGGGAVTVNTNVNTTLANRTVGSDAPLQAVASGVSSNTATSQSTSSDASPVSVSLLGWSTLAVVSYLLV